MEQRQFVFASVLLLTCSSPPFQDLVVAYNYLTMAAVNFLWKSSSSSIHLNVALIGSQHHLHWPSQARPAKAVEGPGFSNFKSAFDSLSLRYFLNSSPSFSFSPSSSLNCSYYFVMNGYCFGTKIECPPESGVCMTLVLKTEDKICE